MSLLEFDLLVEEGKIGFYKSCKIVTVFIFDNKEKQGFNLFTRITFQEKGIGTISPKVDMLGSIGCEKYNKNLRYKLGILKHEENITTARDIFKNLANQNKWIYKYKNASLKISNLRLLPKQIIQFWDDPLLLILKKNNGGQCNYVMEFFDEDKTKYDFLLDAKNKEELEKLGKLLTRKENMPIHKVQDRIGNIVFQFPIDIMKIKKISETTDIIEWHKDLIKIPEIRHIRWVVQDNNIVDVRMEDIDDEYIIDISCRKEPQHAIIDVDNDLVLYTLNKCPSAGHSMTVYVCEVERIIEGKKQNFWLSKNEFPMLKKDYKYWNNLRFLQSEKDKLESNLSFKQFYKDQSQEAINFVKSLMDRYGSGGISIWDPFLTAKEIRDTLYYCKYYHASYKAIGHKTTYNSADENIIFQEMKNASGFWFEFRRKTGNNGYNFHDRFIIFPKTGVEQVPRVWSLGTSLNSIGKEHHIIQEVSHPQYVLEAFEKLWESLNVPECLIFKTGR